MQADRRGYVSSPRRWRIAAGGGGLVALCRVGGCSGWAVMAAERCERFVRLVDGAARRDARVTSSPELAVPASTDSILHAKGKFIRYMYASRRRKRFAILTWFCGLMDKAFDFGSKD